MNKKMKALCLTGYGKNIRKNLKFIESEIPQTKSNEVLIEIYAAGINPVDYKIVYGAAKIVRNPPRPFALGFDMSGVIIEIGDDVGDFNVGDEVFSKVPWDQMGTIATHILVNSDMVALKPKTLNFIEAAGLPLVGCTVIESFEVAKIKAGTKILIHAGSGGIGTFAIQYAKLLGAYVYTTTSTENIDLVKRLGADHVIDYKKEDYRKILNDLDVVYDTLGKKYTKDAVKLVKNGGVIISIAGHYDDETLEVLGINKILRFLNRLKGNALMSQIRAKNIFYKHVWSYPNQKYLNQIRTLVDEEKIEAVVDKEFLFEDAIDALNYLESNRAKGKVIIKIKD